MCPNVFVVVVEVNSFCAKGLILFLTLGVTSKITSSWWSTALEYFGGKYLLLRFNEQVMLLASGSVE